MGKGEADIIIIGGGAAGLMAAIGACKMGAKPVVLEKMPRPGRKIMITGKGRCNFTNVKDWNDFSPSIRSNTHFVKPSFQNLKPVDVLDLLEENGLPYVIERGGRAFPASYKASDVIDTLVRTANRGGAKILTGKEVKSIEKKEKTFITRCTDGSEFLSKAVIIATGGLSYPSTGSTGDGYRIAGSFGHKIVECFPSLTAIVPEGYKAVSNKGHIDRQTPLSKFGKQLLGLQLKNVEISLFCGPDLVQQEFGDLDFTDGGLEGPIGFAISRNAVKGMLGGGKMKVVIDLKPAVEAEKLAARIRREFPSPPFSYGNILAKLLPKALGPIFRQLQPNPTPEALAEALKSWTLPLQGYVGYERSVVTAGGVDTSEVSSHSLESRLCRNLFFCGEVLDIDANTGGYNLQCAFSTGMLSGMSAAASVVRD